jgi:hypothetical protein
VLGLVAESFNLASLCRFHHRKVHEGAVAVQVLDDGAIRFTYPNGRSFDSVAPDHVRSFDWTHLPTDNKKRGIHINARTAATRWAGESMDYGLGVQVLLQQAKRSKNIPAGTSKTLRGGNDR